MNCREATRLASELIPGGKVPWRLRLHLAICGSCRMFRRQTIIIARVMKHLSRVPGDRGPKLPPEARARIKAALDA